MKETSIKLMHKVEDLEDVRQLMAVLREVREKEASIDEVRVYSTDVDGRGEGRVLF